MKTYRELYFRGTEDALKTFVKRIGSYATDEWKKVEDCELGTEYLIFDYIGNSVDKARVFIWLGEHLRRGELRVVNIVPMGKRELSVDEYNIVLVKFYNDVIRPYKTAEEGIDITEPTSDTFEPTTVITKEALKKLKSFCRNANKSTGSSHPLDRERWFDFICQTVDDNKMFNYDTLTDFLQDEEYWGHKAEKNMGVVGDFAWDERNAEKLAAEYENYCEILLYYKRTRG